MGLVREREQRALPEYPGLFQLTLLTSQSWPSLAPRTLKVQNRQWLALHGVDEIADSQLPPQLS